MVNNDSNSNFWYINFNIRGYKKIDDIIDIINLIDEKMVGEDIIYGTDIIIKIDRSNNTQYDYICITNIECGDEIMKDFLRFKFKQVQNLIKFYNSQFGFDWEINFELE